MSFKKSMAVLAVSSAFTIAATSASAEGAYVGVQYGMTTLDASASGASVDWKPSNLVLLGGFDLNDNFAIEGRYGLSLSDDTNSGVSAEVDMTGVYVKASVSSGMLSPYAMLGYANTEVEVSFDELSGSDSETDFSYGLGLDIVLSEKIDLNLEYMSYYSDKIDGVDFDITTIGLGAKFKF